MTLQRKLTLFLLSGLVLTLVITGTILQMHSNSALAALGTKNQTIMEEMEIKNVENIEQATSGFIERGEMEELDAQLARLRTIPGLVEFSLHDAQGKITHSSQPDRVGQALPGDLTAALLATPHTISRHIGNAVEVYRPLVAAQSCLPCHGEWKEGQIGGVETLRFSAEPLTKAQNNWSLSLSDLRRNTLSWSLGAVLAIALLLTLLIMILVRTTITRTLFRVIGELNRNSTELGHASVQILQSSQTLVEGANHQAASLEETSASLNETTTMAEQNATNARHATTLAEKTVASADIGVADMNEMRSAMDAIKQSSNDIAKIIKTIDEIAFQTNILALNAAVEAARAGEAGAGFAVVAEEVRNLSFRSATAAKETEQQIATAIHNGSRGVILAEKVSRALGDIAGHARQVNSLVGEIARASEEQNSGISEINQAVAQIDQVTQANAATADDTTQLAEALHRQDAQLHVTVNEIASLVMGDAHRTVRKGNPQPAAKPTKTRPQRATAAPRKAAPKIAA